ncbi:restless-like transposase [Pochonia chlamydosporia 170]|uniref:Restless-like transposase n=1 Tax=Pochonia chlamydosporia 170 TaxID=1380566 RepID=A0A219AP26_METCM|nr:restless-like transposase [Pochonia chlamydosporia 170]OWT42471.1 restless-like transposase [Pochonia chlamydosporia 170]
MQRFSQVNRSNTGTMAANVALFARSADDDYLAVPEKPVEDADTTAESSQFSESSSPLARRKRVRTPTALNIWAESRQPNRHEPERNKHGQKIWYCKRCSYSQAAHNRVRGHLRDKHCVLIFEHQSAKKLGQGVAIDRLFRQQAARQNGQDVERERYLRASVDEVAYNQALVNLITAHSLPHSLVEWPECRQLRKALLALRELEGSHSGEAIAETFLQVVDSYGVRAKMGYFTLDNAYNNDTMMHTVAETCGFNSTHRRLRCNGHIINLAVQAFLFGKNKEASDEALRQVSRLSRREQEGAVGRAETATAWRQYGALGMLHNLVVWIRSSTQRYQAFLQAAGRIIPQDNSTRWNSWYRMIHVAIALRKELNSFMDDRYSESDIRFDYLHPEHWQELQEIHDFLQPFYEITKDTQWDKTSLDEVICSMDFLVTHYKAAMEQFQHNTTMVDRIMTSWYKFDDYYTRTDDTPVYAAAILLHPSLREAHLKEAWKDQPQYIGPAIAAVRKLWDDFKPQQEPEIEEDLSAYEAYKKRIYQKSSCHDEFSRFIEGPTLPIGDSSALSWWLEPTQQTSYPSLYHLAINIFSIPAMSAEAERVFSGARRTVSWDRGRLSAQIVEYTECLKHWIKSGLLDQPYMIPEPMDAELDSRDIEMLSEGIEPRVVPLE